MPISNYFNPRSIMIEYTRLELTLVNQNERLNIRFELGLVNSYKRKNNPYKTIRSPHKNQVQLLEFLLITLITIKIPKL